MCDNYKILYCTVILSLFSVVCSVNTETVNDDVVPDLVDLAVPAGALPALPPALAAPMYHFNVIGLLIGHVIFASVFACASSFDLVMCGAYCIFMLCMFIFVRRNKNWVVLKFYPHLAAFNINPSAFAILHIHNFTIAQVVCLLNSGFYLMRAEFSLSVLFFCIQVLIVQINTIIYFTSVTSNFGPTQYKTQFKNAIYAVYDKLLFCVCTITFIAIRLFLLRSGVEPNPGPPYYLLDNGLMGVVWVVHDVRQYEERVGAENSIFRSFHEIPPPGIYIHCKDGDEFLHLFRKFHNARRAITLAVSTGSKRFIAQSEHMFSLLNLALECNIAGDCWVYHRGQTQSDLYPTGRDWVPDLTVYGIERNPGPADFDYSIDTHRAHRAKARKIIKDEKNRQVYHKFVNRARTIEPTCDYTGDEEDLLRVKQDLVDHGYASNHVMTVPEHLLQLVVHAYINGHGLMHLQKLRRLWKLSEDGNVPMLHVDNPKPGVLIRRNCINALLKIGDSDFVQLAHAWSNRPINQMLKSVFYWTGTTDAVVDVSSKAGAAAGTSFVDAAANQFSQLWSSITERLKSMSNSAWDSICSHPLAITTAVATIALGLIGPDNFKKLATYIFGIRKSSAQLLDDEPIKEQVVLPENQMFEFTVFKGLSASFFSSIENAADSVTNFCSKENFESIKKLGTLTSSLNSITTFLGKLREWSVFIIDKSCQFITGRPFFDSSQKIFDLRARVETMMNTVRKFEINTATDEIRRKYVDDYMQLVEIAPALKWDSQFQAQVNACVKEAATLFKQVNGALNSAKFRQEPVWIYLHGLPEAGKTLLTKYLLRLVWSRLLAKHRQVALATKDSESFSDTDIYTRSSEQVYWDGYYNQWACIFDDFLQSTTPDMMCAEGMAIIRAGNSAPYPLHMASIDRKEGTTFNSKIIVSSTNAAEGHIDNVPVVDPNAIRRRRDFVVEVIRDMDAPKTVTEQCLENYTLKVTPHGCGTITLKGRNGVVVLVAYIANCYESKYNDYLSYNKVPITDELYAHVANIDVAPPIPLKRLPNYEKTSPPKRTMWKVKDTTSNAKTTSTTSTSSAGFTDEGYGVGENQCGARSSPFTPLFYYPKFLDKERVTQQFKDVWCWITRLPWMGKSYAIDWFDSMSENFKVFRDPRWRSSFMERGVTVVKSYYNYVAASVPTPLDIFKALLPARFFFGVGHWMKGAADKMSNIANSAIYLPLLAAARCFSESCDYYYNKIIEFSKKSTINTILTAVTAIGILAGCSVLIHKMIKLISSDPSSTLVPQSNWYDKKGEKMGRKGARRLGAGLATLPKEQMSDETASSVLNLVHKGVWVIEAWIGERTSVQQAVQLEGSLFVTTTHFLNRDGITSIKLYPTEEKKNTIEVSMNKVLKFHIPDRDLTIFNITATMPLGKKISHFLPKKESAGKFNNVTGVVRLEKYSWRASNGQYIDDHGVLTDIPYGLSVSNVPVRYLTESETTDNPLKGTYQTRLIEVTQRGDCGKPYIFFNTGVPSEGKLAGFHTAGNENLACFSPLYQEDVTEAIAHFKTLLPPIVNQCLDMTFSEPYIHPDDTWFSLKPATGVWNSCPIHYETSIPFSWPHRTKLLKTPFAQDTLLTKDQVSYIKKPPYPVLTGPAALRPVNGKDPALLSMAAVNDRTIKLFGWFDDLSVFDGFFNQVLDHCNPEFLTVYEAIKGDPVSGLRSMQRKSSSGAPYQHLGQKCHFILFEQEEFDAIPRDSKSRFVQLKDIWVDYRILDAIADWFKTAKSGQIPLDLSLFCLKDEPRPLDKVASCATRAFQVGPIVFQIVCRMIFGRFTHSFESQWFDTDGCIGINPYSADWKVLYDSLNTTNFKALAFDTKKWDMHFPFLEFPIPFTRRYCEFFNITNVETVRCIYAATIVNLYFGMVVVNKVAMTWMMGSGRPMTAVFNTIANSAVNRVLCKAVAEEYNFTIEFCIRNTPKTKHSVCIKTYGDDMVMTLSKSIVETVPIRLWVDLAQYMFGQTRTDPLKGNDHAYMELADVYFLKRKFIRLDNVVLAPLEIDAIYAMIQYIMTPTDKSFAAQFSTVGAQALSELAYHTEEAYETFRSHFNEYCRALYGPSYCNHVTYKHARENVVNIALKAHDVASIF